nr:DMT family transporter [uncultured Roseovarius sp.]
MTRYPLFGLGLALFGALVLTPDAMLMRLSQMDGVQMMAWRGLSMGSVMVAGWALFSRTRRADIAAGATGFGAMIVLCQSVNSALFCLGIATAPVAVVLFGVATVPVFSALFAWALLGDRTRPATWLTIAAVLTGIGVAVFGSHSGEIGFDWASALGAAAGLGVAMALALNFVVLRARPDLPIALLIGLGALCSGVIGIVLTDIEAMPDGRLWAMILTGAVVLPISFFSLSLATRYTPASNVSLLLLLETVLGPLWVWLALGEAASPTMLLGGAIVVLSLALYLLNERRVVLRQRCVG